MKIINSNQSTQRLEDREKRKWKNCFEKRQPIKRRLW